MAEVTALGFWGGLPLPPGVGGNDDWGPPASWDLEQDGLVDENGDPIDAAPEEPLPYPPPDQATPPIEEDTSVPTPENT